MWPLYYYISTIQILFSSRKLLKYFQCDVLLDEGSKIDDGKQDFIKTCFMLQLVMNRSWITEVPSAKLRKKRTYFQFRCRMKNLVSPPAEKDEVWIYSRSWKYSNNFRKLLQWGYSTEINFCTRRVAWLVYYFPILLDRKRMRFGDIILLPFI